MFFVRLAGEPGRNRKGKTDVMCAPNKDSTNPALNFSRSLPLLHVAAAPDGPDGLANDFGT